MPEPISKQDQHSRRSKQNHTKYAVGFWRVGYGLGFKYVEAKYNDQADNEEKNAIIRQLKQKMESFI